jgi:hypothetical protein
MIYVGVAIIAVAALVSFAVDYGRVQLAKTELRRGADAAARAGASALGNYTAVQNLAVQYAGANNVDGSPLALSTAAASNDIEFGTWDTSTRTFAILTAANRNYANAVRINAARTAAKGNPIPLTFARILGRDACDVTASSIAMVTSTEYGLVGINSIKLSGNTSASYWSSSGSVGGNAGNIASNGNITSTGTSTIAGTVWKQAGATVSGISANQIKTLSNPLSYANGDPGSYNSTNNNNGLLTPSSALSGPGGQDLKPSASTAVTLPAGTYYFHDVNIPNTASVTCLGTVKIYCWHNFSMSGQAVTNGSVPQNLSLVMCPSSSGAAPGTVSISGSAALYADIYAPQSDITLSGSGAIYGSIVGRNVTISGTSDMYYDLSGISGGAIHLVK